MIRLVAPLIVGCLIGGGIVYVFVGTGGAGSGPKSLVESVADFALGRDRPEGADAPTVSESLETYRAAAGETDPIDIRSALEAAAARPWSPARDLEIDALLARLADLGPAEAARLAGSLGLETRFVADAWLYWAGVEPEAAIRALAEIDGHTERREVALALLDVFGDNNAGLERVSAGLADAERTGLKVEWITARAEYDPYGAFREAQQLDGTSQAARALERIGTAWAAQDPLSALAQAELLPEPLKSPYLTSVFREWARLDAYGYLGWLESAASPPSQAVVGLQLLAGSHPDLVIGIADGMSGNIAQSARTLAMRALAEADPEAAKARVLTMPAGTEREMLLMAVGSALARRDPDGALAWAESLPAPSRNLTTQILFQIAQSNPERAIELLDDPPPGVDPQLIVSIATSFMTSSTESAQVLADKLVASDSIQSSNALRSLVGNWMQQDPERALDWVLAHEGQINATVLGAAAQSMARADPVAAAGYIDRIPAEYRAAWITRVAGPYALRDPNAALGWVAQFQGQQVYDSALRSVITASAQTDARSAAEALSQASPQVQLGAASQVAALYAREDPRAAARWSESLTDERARNGAVGAAVGAWAAADFGAAQSYAMGLDRGETRDQALSTLVVRSAQSGDFERGLLDAFSSDSATQDALARAIPLISREDPEEARALLERVTSGETRRQIEEQIERLASSPVSIF